VSLNRYARRRDDVEPALVDHLETRGCTILKLDIIDALVWHEGRIYLAEFKSKGGKLTAHQKLLIDYWPGPVHVLRNVRECDEMLGIRW
jgi:hypothetical protein